MSLLLKLLYNKGVFFCLLSVKKIIFYRIVDAKIIVCQYSVIPILK